ncbi:Transposase [Geodermatophilus pulveris]|uniref:Transposase n=1 Tax=Geodermatophilus pulveris TaxID=1564159 RepID=A0A239CLC0_9ACTN|nr:Transposase [Geodermatophilus pulveris]
MSSTVLSDADWARLEPLLPRAGGVRGRPFRDHRQVVEGILFRHRTGCAWRHLPADFGPWQTVWKRHRRFCMDGTWDRVMAVLQPPDAPAPAGDVPAAARPGASGPVVSRSARRMVGQGSELGDGGRGQGIDRQFQTLDGAQLRRYSSCAHRDVGRHFGDTSGSPVPDTLIEREDDHA